MATMTGLLALAVVGGGPAADPCDEAISVQVRTLDMEGLGWRSDAYSRLRPVTTRGTTSVWTADRALLADLISRAKAVTTAPRRDAVGEAVIAHKQTVHYIAQVGRIADGPINESSKVAYQPEKGSFEAGIEARVRGRKLDQGVLTQVALADSRVLAMHTVKVGEMVTPGKPAASKATSKAPSVESQLFKLGFELAFGSTIEPARCGFGTSFQVPEVARTEIEGEWLIPNDGILVVSLGVDTVADAQGRAVARDRLAVLEVSPDAAPLPIAVSTLNTTPAHSSSMVGSTEPFPYRSYADIVADPSDAAARPAGARTPVASAPSRVDTKFAEIQSSPKTDAVVAASFEAAPAEAVRPTPPAPSRMLPVPIDAQGNVVELPPLPIAESTIDDAFKPAANQPSPQSIHLSAIDPSVSQASFSAAAPGVTTSIVSTSGPSIAFGLQMKDGRGTPVQEVEKDLTAALKAPGKTETVRVPLGGNLSLEIKATVVPASPAVEGEVAARPDAESDRR